MTLEKAAVPFENGEGKAFGDPPSPNFGAAGTLPQSGTAREACALTISQIVSAFFMHGGF